LTTEVSEGSANGGSEVEGSEDISVVEGGLTSITVANGPLSEVEVGTNKLEVEFVLTVLSIVAARSKSTSLSGNLAIDEVVEVTVGIIVAVVKSGEPAWLSGGVVVEVSLHVDDDKSVEDTVTSILAFASLGVEEELSGTSIGEHSEIAESPSLVTIVVGSRESLSIAVAVGESKNNN